MTSSTAGDCFHAVYKCCEPDCRAGWLAEWLPSCLPATTQSNQIEDAKTKLGVVTAQIESHRESFLAILVCATTPPNQIEDAKAKLEVVTALHVYSVQPGVPKVRCCGWGWGCCLGAAALTARSEQPPALLAGHRLHCCSFRTCSAGSLRAPSC